MGAAGWFDSRRRVNYGEPNSLEWPSPADGIRDGWAAFMRDSGLEEERIGHVLADHRDSDLPEPPAQQLAYLQDAGFVAELAWSWEKFALFYAEKR